MANMNTSNTRRLVENFEAKIIEHKKDADKNDVKYRPRFYNANLRSDQTTLSEIASVKPLTVDTSSFTDEEKKFNSDLYLGLNGIACPDLSVARSCLESQELSTTLGGQEKVVDLELGKKQTKESLLEKIKGSVSRVYLWTSTPEVVDECLSYLIDNNVSNIILAYDFSNFKRQILDVQLDYTTRYRKAAVVMKKEDAEYFGKEHGITVYEI